MKIALVPFYKTWENNKIFDKNFGRDNILEPYRVLKEHLLSKSIEINTNDITSIEKSDLVVFLRLELKLLFKAILNRKKTIYIQFEPSVIFDLHSTKNMNGIVKYLFNRVLTWNDDLVHNDNFYKFQVPMPKYAKPESISFDNKKFLTNISGYKVSNYKNELYSERVKALRFFEKKAKAGFDLYGVGWENEGFECYKGPCKNKNDILREYKFSLCYENQSGLNGLISEKIFDCFYAQCVPIFWGAENITSYIPSKCFIDKRKFSSYDSLLNYISTMSKSEYIERLDAIKEYINSEPYTSFSSQAFAENILMNIKKINSENTTSMNARVYGLIRYMLFNFKKSFVEKNKRLLRLVRRV